MFTFQFTEEQVNYILNLIAEKPFKEVHTLVTSIQQQAQQQLQERQAAAQAQQAGIQQAVDAQGLTTADIVSEPPKKK